MLSPVATTPLVKAGKVGGVVAGATVTGAGPDMAPAGMMIVTAPPAAFTVPPRVVTNPPSSIREGTPSPIACGSDGPSSTH